MHIDAEVIESLRALGEAGSSAERSDFLGEIIDAYLGDSRVKLAAICSSWERRDAQALARTSHSLKGSSGNIGAVILAGQCASIEAEARKGNLAGLEQVLASLQAEFSTVVQELRMLRSGGRGN